MGKWEVMHLARCKEDGRAFESGSALSGVLITGPTLLGQVRNRIVIPLQREIHR